MKRQVLGLLAIAVSLAASPASAMNWCALPSIIPEREADLERMAPAVAAMTGCERQASDSAHRVAWHCADDPATADANETVHVIFDRQPGEGIHLLVLASGLTDLDMLRSCGERGMQDGERFSAGNVAFRDSVSFDYGGRRLTLAAIEPDGLSTIVSDLRTFGDDDFVKGLWQGIHGVTTEAYPSTSVKLAGLSPIASDVFAVANAFIERGSAVQASEGLDTVFPGWTLSPPVGLGGVTEVRLSGFVRHLLQAEYVLASTADYERFIGLLDAEYGRSERTSADGCTYRWWESGRVSISGQHCPDQPDTLSFFNDVAGDQLQQVAASLEAEAARSASPEATPAIDADMF